MRLRHSCLVAAIAGIGFVSAAHATLSVTVNMVPYNTGATTDDPSQLGGNHLARTFEVDVTTSAGEKWTFGSMRTTAGGGSTATAPLDFGTFYVPTTANSSIGQESLWATTGTRHTYNDTFVTAPSPTGSPDPLTGNGATSGSRVTILGKSDYPTNQTGSAIMPAASNAADTLDITWGDQQAVAGNAPNGTYGVARFTTEGISAGRVVGHIGGTAHNFTDQTFSFEIPVPFDFNHDGFGDASDLPDAQLLIAGNYDAYVAKYPTADPNYFLYVGDLNGDGFVDASDIPQYQFVIAGGGPAGVAALGALVPEPATLSALCVGALALASRRRRV